ncbi:metalloregulator ArsR/SmtB family transcription factor [Cytobacillus sp. IB215665]|uniref:DUF2087 domain-containing protein n=1 Tax=Cytobacillus sp. IB215665 TaxID=3097357 RepID=UPI002A0B5A47|nr:metalloregulator ArsR/SmtB family transcription factor [Cytobacillus sp. IB215665]MDX8367375.1 metalloregulator ArsR/SmtB family transcription factor [Cytobacillus sp. IB215665]
MQLEKIVQFHKVLGDPTRIRILVLLAQGPLHGQAIAGKLGLRPPTITHHVTKLRDLGLIKEKREKNTIYFYLNKKDLEHKSLALINVINHKGEIGMSRDTNNQAILNNFVTSDGKLKTIPAQRKKKLIILEYIIKGLEQGRKYTEREINEHIKQFHDDYATLRRELIMGHYMYREKGIYELNPQEMWAKID